MAFVQSCWKACPRVASPTTSNGVSSPVKIASPTGSVSHSPPISPPTSALHVISEVLSQRIPRPVSLRGRILTAPAILVLGASQHRHPTRTQPGRSMVWYPRPPQSWCPSSRRVSRAGSLSASCLLCDYNTGPVGPCAGCISAPAVLISHHDIEPIRNSQWLM
nr:hypothetical protein F5148DRAFT_256342 [Russula earlei]